MALTPIDEAHALQIQAGALGRKSGHAFEDEITQQINRFDYPIKVAVPEDGHVFNGDPATKLLHYIGSRLGIKNIISASALSTGALATSEAGKQWLSINGATVSRCKSDLILSLVSESDQDLTIGISTKQCNNKTPTNAQLYFTTARGFSTLLQSNDIAVSDNAVHALRQFCGDIGFRPFDDKLKAIGRLTDLRRYFWEEIDTKGRNEWEHIFKHYQDAVTRLLLQKGYLNDPFVPEYLLHKTKFATSWQTTEVAIYSIDEFISLSRRYQGFATKSYSVRKGTYKDPQDVAHLAPRFGVIQMQRGGQQQHPEQLQFNLEAGYFYKI